jgi:hypothetical protein
MTAHLSRTDTPPRSSWQNRDSDGSREMNNEEFVRRAYEWRRETIKPSHLDPGRTETLGPNLEHNRMTRRARRITAVVAALRQQAAGGAPRRAPRRPGARATRRAIERQRERSRVDA